MSHGRQEDTETNVDTPSPVEESLAVDPVVAALEARIAELEAENAKVKAEVHAVKVAFHQKVEEMAGTRERMERQAKLQDELRRGEVVTTFFEPVENLHRSIEAAKGQTVEAGLRMVHLQFMEALKRLGLEEVPGVGSPFNADVHEALATVPVTDAAQDGKVLQVYSTGYRLGTRLVRAARVVIGAYAGTTDG
jgi:molecular chaperone GrpE